MLRQGVWLDRQVIPAEWVRESTQPIVASTRMNPPAIRQSHLGYGYLWWILEEAPGSLLAGAYSARGAYGQYILVVPKIDMVVAHKRMIPRGDNSSVSWEQFIEIARQLVGARCPKGECLATAN
jgi:CubicO group peptidase (beta-lactamase class C family)